MNNLIKVELRDPEIFFIDCVSAQVHDTFQTMFLHYKKKSGCEFGEDKIINIVTYHNYEEFKNDRDILENILNNQRVIK